MWSFGSLNLLWCENVGGKVDTFKGCQWNIQGEFLLRLSVTSQVSNGNTRHTAGTTDSHSFFTFFPSIFIPNEFLEIKFLGEHRTFPEVRKSWKEPLRCCIVWQIKESSCTSFGRHSMSNRKRRIFVQLFLFGAYMMSHSLQEPSKGKYDTSFV